MPAPIQEYTIKIIWENNPDTPITASALSKDFDFLATYQDFEFPVTPPHREVTLLMQDDDDILRLILKRGSMFQIINEAEDPPGTPIIPINSQYRVFDIGLEDLYLTFNDMDEDISNPSGNWGPSNEWFIYICDKDDSTIYQESSPDFYGGGAQILLSRHREFPWAKVPGRVNPLHVNVGRSEDYTERDTRLIGGFKSDSINAIIPDSIWDISGKTHTVKAKHYWVLDEYGVGLDARYIYRQINLTDLDTSSDNIINTFGNDVTIHGNLTQDSGNNSFIGNVSIDGDFDLEASNIILDGDILIGSRVNSPINHTGDFLNNSTNFEINTAYLNISATENFITSAPTWTHGGDLTIHGDVNQDTGIVDIDGNIIVNNITTSMTSTNFDTHGTWDHYGNFLIHSTVNIGESGDVADLTIYSNFNQTGSSDFTGVTQFIGNILQVSGNVTFGTSAINSTVNINGPIIQEYGLVDINSNVDIDNTSTDITSTNINTNTSGTFTHTGDFTITTGDFTVTNGNLIFTGDLTVQGNFEASNFPHFTISTASPSGGIHGDWWAVV